MASSTSYENLTEEDRSNMAAGYKATMSNESM